MEIEMKEIKVSYDNSHVVISVKDLQDFHIEIPDEPDSKTHGDTCSKISDGVNRAILNHYVSGRHTNRTTHYIDPTNEYDVALLKWFVLNDQADYSLGYSDNKLVVTFKMHLLNGMVNLKTGKSVECPTVIIEEPEWMLGDTAFLSKYQVIYNGNIENPQRRFSLAYGFYADHRLDYYLSEDEICLNGGRFSGTQHVDYTDDTVVWKHAHIILMKNVPDIMDVIRQASDRRWTCAREHHGRLMLFVQDDGAATLIKTLYAQFE